MNEIKIIDKSNRKLLVEGRDNGMAFAFLKSLKNNFKTVMPLSPCKDFLAEPLITENYGIGTQMWGLKYPKKLNIFSNVAYMAIKMLKSKSDTYNYSTSFEDDVNKLKENYEVLENFINQFEKKIDNISSFTEINKANDDMFLVTIPIEWVNSTHAISLYTFLLRIGMFAEKQEEEYDFIKYLSDFKYNGGDKGLCMSIIPKLKLILNNKKIPPNTVHYTINGLKHGQSPHNNGIVNWNETFTEIEISE